MAAVIVPPLATCNVQVWAVAYDNPIPGYETPTVGNLRLWSAEPVEEFDLAAFNTGDYDKAMAARDRADSISAVLYPNDATPEGKELRLKQQYFFVSAALQVRSHLQGHLECGVAAGLGLLGKHARGWGALCMAGGQCLLGPRLA